MSKTKNGNGETALAKKEPGLSSMLGELSNPTDLCTDGGYTAEVFMSWKDFAGKEIRGILVGKGAPVKMTDPTDGKERDVDTWRILSEGGGLVLTVAGSAQLDARLGSIQPGTSVVIQHHGKTQSAKGRNVNNFMVFTGQLKDLPGHLLPASQQSSL